MDPGDDRRAVPACHNRAANAALGEEPAVTTSQEAAATRPRGAGAPGFELHGPGTPVSQLVRDLWRARRVLGVLARKEFYARYRRTSFGLLWAVALPLVQATVLAIVFTRIVHLGSVLHRTNGHVSYPVFLYSGLTAYSFFTSNMPGAATAIVDNAGLARKIYFPRALFPLLVVTTGLYPFAIGVFVLLALTLTLQHHIGIDFLLVVPGCLLTMGITAGLGLVLSALHVYFRDIRFMVQAVMSVLFYLSPVIYSLNAAPGALGQFIAYGPMAGPIELFRLATVGADDGWWIAVLAGIGWFVVSTGAGLLLQSRHDRVFVDLL